MHRAHPFRALALVVGSLCVGGPGFGQPESAAPTPVRSGCEVDYAPFCVVRDGHRADGFSVELLRAALAAVGRDVTFKTATWAEIRGDLAEGRLEALPMVARTPEREAVFDFTFPYLRMHGTIVVRDDTVDIDGPEDLAGRRVAVLREDVAHEYLRGADLGAIVVPLPSFATALRELSEGDHDAVVIQKLLAIQIMESLGLDNLRVVGPPLTGYRQSLCFAVRDGDAELLSLLNEGLSIVMVDGTYRRLHTTWFSNLESAERRRGRIIVGGDANYPPYEFVDSDGKPAGYAVDMTRAIARHMGLSVDFHLAPWAEVRSGLERGRIDVANGMFYSADRDTQFGFTTPHALVQHVAVVRRGSPQVGDVASLAGRSVVVMAGDLMHDLAIQHGLEATVTAVETGEEALRQLASGKHDCALVARVPALYWIERNGWSDLEISREPLLTAEYCFAVPHGKEHLLSTFAEGLATIRQSGEFREIQRRWLAPYDDPSVGTATIAKHVALGSVPLLALLAGSILWSRSLQAQVRRRTVQLQSANQALRHSLEEKNVLLREIHHRVKNNLQVVSSLVNLQADAVADPALREVFGDVRDRVRSMALVHEQLYRSESLAEVDFADYARRLLEQLLRAQVAGGAAIRLELDVQTVTMTVETAVPCGLILNELAGNALKHAFVGRGGGRLSVELARGSSGGTSLAVADDGVGLPPGFDLGAAPTLGLRLVQMLAHQIGATVEVQSAPGAGARFAVRIPDRVDEDDAGGDGDAARQPTGGRMGGVWAGPAS